MDREPVRSSSGEVCLETEKTFPLVDSYEESNDINICGRGFEFPGIGVLS